MGFPNQNLIKVGCLKKIETFFRTPGYLTPQNNRALTEDGLYVAQCIVVVQNLFMNETNDLLKN